ncbi:hypothetical protein SASPL_148391 [Salvia splendens]|uniref:Tetrapyrrole methylase domain-containing protein n=1 Tax=Salvia splendens TaxID=180675 RepID=A0A8X8W992_SALSN|nr:hypothetical protein SASPL_148391 [Salvia splendens]
MKLLRLCHSMAVPFAIHLRRPAFLWYCPILLFPSNHFRLSASAHSQTITSALSFSTCNHQPSPSSDLADDFPSKQAAVCWNYGLVGLNASNDDEGLEGTEVLLEAGARMLGLGESMGSIRGPLKLGLYLVGTPIGNLEDNFKVNQPVNVAGVFLLIFFPRGYKAFRKVAYSQREQVVLKRLLGGEIVALISDAGMPGISDPGMELILNDLCRGPHLRGGRSNYCYGLVGLNASNDDEGLEGTEVLLEAGARMLGLGESMGSIRGPLKLGLYLVGTPIGNLEDNFKVNQPVNVAGVFLLIFFPRGYKAFRKVAYSQREQVVLKRLLGGEIVALISDAGMPGISDPGMELILNDLCRGPHLRGGRSNYCYGLVGLNASNDDEGLEGTEVLLEAGARMLGLGESMGSIRGPLKLGLYLVGTPIGNLEDNFKVNQPVNVAGVFLLIFFPRGYKAFRKVAYSQREQVVLKRLLGGEIVALISDAGMPGISDPGMELILNDLCRGPHLRGGRSNYCYGLVGLNASNDDEGLEGTEVLLEAGARMLGLGESMGSIRGPLKLGLYLVGTPIGNLEDNFKVNQPVNVAGVFLLIFFPRGYKAFRKVAYSQREQVVLKRLLGGEIVALISDAGMPGISDPGMELAKLCVDKNIPVIPVPGPSAVVAALSASGLPTNEFTLGVFVPPHKLCQFLEESSSIFGNSRRCVIAREMTKLHEETFNSLPQVDSDAGAVEMLMSSL